MGFYLIFGDELVYALFGTKFLPAAELLKIAAVGVVLNILIMINFSVLSGLGKVKERAKIIWIVAVWNVISDIAFVIWWGLKGVVYSTLVGWVLLWLLSVNDLKKSLRWHWPLDSWFWIKNLIYLIVVFGLAGWLFDFEMALEIGRIKTFAILAGLGFGAGLGLALINWRSVRILKDLVFNLKNNET